MNNAMEPSPTPEPVEPGTPVPAPGTPGSFAPGASNVARGHAPRNLSLALLCTALMDGEEDTIFDAVIDDLDNNSDADVASDLNNLLASSDDVESFFAGLSTDQRAALFSSGRLDKDRANAILLQMNETDREAWLAYYADMVQKGYFPTL